MSAFFDPYNADRPLMLRCACGQDHAPGEHDAAARVALSEEAASRNFIEATLVKALFPVDSVRRGFLRAVGAGTARAAIAVPLPTARRKRRRWASCGNSALTSVASMNSLL